MRYLELAPAPALRPLIRCYWFLSGSGGGGSEPALPDGSPELIVNLAAPMEAGVGLESQSLVALVGQITAPLELRATGPVDIVGVRFEPHGARVLTGDLATLTDRWVDGRDLDRIDLWALRERLGDAPSPGRRADRLDRHFGDLIRRTDYRSAGAVTAAIARIRHAAAADPLAGLAATLGTSLRSLQRGFAAEVGISPKLFARICRFQRVLAARRAGPTGWARAAVECGYYDQAHLIRDFRQFAGATPTDLLATDSALWRLFAGQPGR